MGASPGVDPGVCSDYHSTPLQRAQRRYITTNGEEPGDMALSLRDQAIERFQQHFGTTPEIVARGPGRVPLLGSHTDYNEGFVLPAAIDRAVWLAARRRTDRNIHLWSLNFDQGASLDLDALSRSAEAPWTNYVAGVADVLQRSSYSVCGFDGVVVGDVPLGAGLSSSAAIEVATATVLSELAGIDVAKPELARICQRAENEFVGMNCGILDQFISLLGQREHAMFLDCRNLAYELLPLDTASARIVVSDTRKPRELVDSQYNVRRAECEEGARLLGVHALRDVTAADFERRANELPEMIARRCRHVITENRRTEDAKAALCARDLKAFGRLMDEAQDSFREDYDASCRELDIMVDVARSVPGVMGSMTAGAGWGGCVVSLVETPCVDDFVAAVMTRYTERADLHPEVYVCQAADGASVERL